MESSAKRRSAQSRLVNEKRCGRSFLLQILGERVFGSVMADYVGDYVSANYFVELSTSQ